MSEQEFIREMQQVHYELFDWLDTLLQLLEERSVKDLSSAERFNKDLAKLLEKIEENREGYDKFREKFEKRVEAKYVPGAILNLSKKGQFFNKSLKLFQTLDGFRG